MWSRIGLLLSFALVVALGAAEAAPAPSPVYLEVSAANGARLGHLAGQLDGRVAYFALDDVARIVGGTVRSTSRGDGAALVVQRKAIEVRRDRSRVRVAGQSVTLSAPVRVRRGIWLVPGELLVRALPAVIGSGVRVTTGTAAPAARPVIQPVSTTPGSPQAPVRPIPAVLRETPAPRTPRPAPAPDETASPEPPSSLSAPRADADTKLRNGSVELRYRSYPAYTRVVLESTTALEPRLVEQDGGLVVSLVGAATPPARTVRAVRDGLVGSLELTAVRGAAALRVEFERMPGSRKVYHLEDPPRLVLDFYRAVPAPRRPESTRTVGIRTIVIDPGHGGHDPGAIGPGGVQEKDLTLDVARRVAALLQDDLDVRVILTRADDRFLALRERTARANREKADLFVSIHVNAAPAMAASGAETYFLSTEATDNAARAAAAYENKVIDLEPRAGAGGDVLRSILWDLAQSDFQRESSRLAEALQESLDRALRSPSRGVKQAPFYVLGGAAMPAVLIEIGFITNAEEERRLKDDGYRDRIARAIEAGLTAYKRDYDQRAGVVVRR